MSSNSRSQELDCFPGEREKIDGFRLFKTGTTHDAENEAIRKSLAWDSAFFTSPGVLEPEELFQTMNSQNPGNAINLLGHDEEMLLPSESLEPERTRKSDYSFRRSLAWDNAFFTSAGVLDPEELSIVNRGFKKCETDRLPGIQEVWRSAKSFSAMDSGCSSLMKSLEFELFEDNRSSVKKPSSLSGVTTSSLELKRERGIRSVRTSKKPDASSRMRMKAIPMSERQSLNVRRPERISKEASVASQKQVATGSWKLNASISLKPPKISSRVNQSSTAASKRSCLGGDSAKLGTAKAAPGQPKSVSKKPCLGVSCSVTNSFKPSPKSSSSGSPTTSHESRVHCSPYKGFRNASEDNAGKYPVRRKINSSLVNLASKGFTLGTPLQSTKTDKDELEISCHHSSLSVTPKSSSHASPASSFDGRSSVSSSTSANQLSKISEVSLDTLCRQVSFESEVSQASDAESHSNGNQETRLPNQHDEKILVGSSPVPSSISKHFKPSGLRVPSPKIGFFDEENALMRSSGGMQFHSGTQSIMPRSRTGSGNSNEAANRYGKLQSPRAMSRNVKLASRKSLSPCPTFGISPRDPAHTEVQNDFPDKMNGQNCLRAGEVGGKKHDGKENAELNIKRVKNQATKENEEPSMHCPLQNDDKENAYYFKDQIDALTKHVGAIDLGDVML